MFRTVLADSDVGKLNQKRVWSWNTVDFEAKTTLLVRLHPANPIYVSENLWNLSSGQLRTLCIPPTPLDVRCGSPTSLTIMVANTGPFKRRTDI